MKEFCYCYASGIISFGRVIPKGALEITNSTKYASSKAMHDDIAAVARHAYDGKTFLVPGIPEAETHKKKMEALNKFKAWIEERNQKKEAMA